MKIRIKPKKQSLYSGNASSGNKASGVASWATTDRSQFRALAKAAQTEHMRAPEFWLSDGDRKKIMFVDDDAIAAVRMYQIMKGRRPIKYVAPPKGQPDLFASEMNLRAGTYFIFRIIDIDGYTPQSGKNAGKKMTNQPKFYVVGSRMYEQIKLQLVDTTGEALNSGYVIACRAGSGTTSVYTFMARPGGKTPAIKAAIMKFPKWTEYYSPPSLAQQQSIVSSSGGPDESDE